MSTKQVFESDKSNLIFESDDVLVIKVPKSLTVIEAKSFQQKFMPICESTVLPGKVILDFSTTSFLDSSGIGALASVIKMSKIAGIDLSVSYLTPQVKAVLHMTGLDRLLDIEVESFVDSVKFTSQLQESTEEVRVASH
ncbi:MAG: STAS domain-containing protein [Gammaproteobacteria bacterium]|nr:STAS domain-containing protein [Gammaproteobacteria bacterium]